MTASKYSGGENGHLWDWWNGEGDRCLRCGDKDYMADEFCSNRKKAVMPWEQYCPICNRMITASNIEEVENGEHDGYIFVHDDIFHEDEDIDALQSGVN